MRKEFKVEIIEHKAILEYNAQGWAKEVNLVSWNDRPPVYDIRYWSADHKKMGRGMTFPLDHMKLLKAYLNGDEAFSGPTPEIPDKGAEMRVKRAAREAKRAERRAEKERKLAEREARRNEKSNFEETDSA